MTYRVRNIAVAIGLALVAALLTTFYVANYKRHVQQSESTVPVYVATRDIPAGTLGAQLLKQHLISTESVAQHTVVPGAISSPDQIAGLLTRQDIYSGEQVTLRRFASNAEEGIRSQLHGTLRAISLSGTADQVLRGTLRDGDHVDVVANFKGACPTCAYTRDVARNLLVLNSSPGTLGTQVSSNDNASVVVAANEVREVEKVFFALQNATSWSLQLRPVANATDSPEDVETLHSEVYDNVGPGNLHHMAGDVK